MINIEPVLQKLFKIIENFKPQNPELYIHLTSVMKNQGIYYNETTPIYCVGETVDKLLFISEGFITRSAINSKGNPKILSILEENEIKAGPDFIDRTPSEFVIEATPGTFVAYLTNNQLQTIYQKFPETRELISLIISAHNRKELRLKKLFSVKGIDLVEAFYKRYPKMLKPHSGLTNDKIANYLNMGVSTLIEHKTNLINTDKLPNPEEID